jgi:chaperonin GroES
MKTPKWKPSGNKILVHVDKVEKRTAGGLYIPNDAAEKQQMAQMTGVVVSLGPLAFADQPVAWVRVGDHIKFSKYAGYLHQEGDEDYRVMHDLDVIMVEG